MSVQRLSIPKASPEGYAALTAVETYIQRSGLPTSLVDLVKMRASQINGCAFCLDMHSKDARKLGKRSSGSTSSMPGESRRSTRQPSVLPWPGPSL